MLAFSFQKNQLESPRLTERKADACLTSLYSAARTAHPIYLMMPSDFGKQKVIRTFSV